jgi:hypothetical protein
LSEQGGLAARRRLNVIPDNFISFLDISMLKMHFNCRKVRKISCLSVFTNKYQKAWQIIFISMCFLRSKKRTPCLETTADRPSVCDLVTKTKRYVGLFKFWYMNYFQKLLHKREFREHRLTDIHTLLKRAKKSTCIFHIFLPIWNEWNNSK